MRSNILIGFIGNKPTIINPDSIFDPKKVREIMQDIKLNGSKFDEIYNYVEPLEKIRKARVTVAPVVATKK